MLNNSDRESLLDSTISLCREHDITVQDLGILVGVYRGRWVYPTDIANGLCTGRPNISRRIKKLDEFVDSVPAQSNRRKIELLPKGKKVAEEYLSMLI